MNLTEEQAREIVAKVCVDLDLYHSNKYPITVIFYDKDTAESNRDIDEWAGGYNYQDPEAVGDDFMGEYPEYNIVIDDQKGEAVLYGHYTGHYYIELKNGKYEVIGKTSETKRPW